MLNLFNLQDVEQPLTEMILWRFWKFPSTWNTTASPLQQEGAAKSLFHHANVTLQTKMHSQVTVDIFCFSLFSVLYTAPLYELSAPEASRWSCHPPPQRPNPVFVSGCKNVYFCCKVYCGVYGDRLTAGGTHWWTLGELQLLQLVACAVVVLVTAADFLFWWQILGLGSSTSPALVNKRHAKLFHFRPAI